MVEFDLGNYYGSSIKNIIYQSDGKCLVLLNYSFDGKSRIVRLLESGEIDGSFGEKGVIEFKGYQSRLYVDAQDGIFSVGLSNYSNNISNFGISRYDKNGKAISSFGNAGVANVQVAGPGDLTEIAIENGGNIILGGVFNGKPTAVQILFNGQADPNFGLFGIAQSDWKAYNEGIKGILSYPNGDVILLGQFVTAYKGANADDFGYSFFYANGGVGLNKGIDFNTNPSRDYVADVFPLNGGGFVGVGYIPQNNQLILAKLDYEYSPWPFLDESFGNNGIKVLSNLPQPVAATSDSNNNIFVAYNIGLGIGVTKLNNNGDVVSQWGQAGSILLNSRINGRLLPQSLAITENGELLVGGADVAGKESHTVIFKINSSGKEDSAWGGYIGPPDTTPPTVEVTSDKSYLTYGQKATINFFLSEASIDFDLSDVSVFGGKLSDFSGAGKKYTASFSPDFNNLITGNIFINPERFSDSFGNKNVKASNTLLIDINTVPSGFVVNIVDGNDNQEGLALYDAGALGFVLSASGLGVGAPLLDFIPLMQSGKKWAPKSIPLSAHITDINATVLLRSGTSTYQYSEQIFSLPLGESFGSEVKISSNEAYTKEIEYSVDITGDGLIGNAISVVLATVNNISIYKIASGDYVIGEAGKLQGYVLPTSIELKTAVGKSYNAKDLSAFLDYGDEFGLISKSGSGSTAKYAEQKFSTDGLAQGKALKLTTAQLLAKEVLADQDINGDGVIGEVVAAVLDGDGDATQDVTGLYQTVAGTVVISSAGLEVSDLVGESLALMASSKKGWLVPKGATVEGIAVTEGGSLEVLTLKGTTFSAQKFDDVTGLMIGKAVKLTTAQLESREYYYDLDLNGDSVISLVGQETPPIGWAV